MITRLKHAIDESGLKQKYIAKKLRMSETALSRYVTGDSELTPEDSKRIANVLKVPRDQIEGVIE